MFRPEVIQIFATRVWGFDPLIWPVITFNLEGYRDKILNESKVGDLIIFVGTKTDRTKEEDRGKILGVAQIGRIPVDTLSVLDKSIITPDYYDANNNFRWPKAIMMTRAWSFPEKPVLTEILSSQLPYNATASAVLLNLEDAEVIKQLQANEIDLPDTETIRNLRNLEIALNKGKPTTGVIPSSWIKTTERILGNPSITYAARFGKTKCYKIGHTTDIKQRLGELNKHVPHEILNEEWKITYKQGWPDEITAYNMEQNVLNSLTTYRTEGERVLCDENVLSIAWTKAVYK